MHYPTVRTNCLHLVKFNLRWSIVLATVVVALVLNALLAKYIYSDSLMKNKISHYLSVELG